MFTGRMSWRRFKVILTHLPPESAFATSVRGAMSPEDLARASAGSRNRPWSTTHELLARVGDGVEVLAWMQTDTKKNPKPPAPFPRPGSDVAPVSPINEAARAYLLEVERLHGARPGPEWVNPAAKGASS